MMDKQKTVKKRKRTGVKVFIALGLVGIVACSAWIWSNWNAGRQAAIGETDAQLISGAAESVSSVEVPEVRTRKNASGNYHVVSHIDTSADLLDACDKAIDAGSMYIELELTAADDGTLNVSGGGESVKLSDVFEKYRTTVSYVLKLESRDAAATLSKTITDSGMQDNVIVESYDAGVLEALEETLPDVTKMYLCNTTNDRSRGLGLGCADIICMGKNLMNQYGLQTVHNAGKKFGIRSVETRQHIRDAIQLGVDIYVTSDTAGALELEKQYRSENTNGNTNGNTNENTDENTSENTNESTDGE